MGEKQDVVLLPSTDGHARARARARRRAARGQRTWLNLRSRRSRRSLSTRRSCWQARRQERIQPSPPAPAQPAENAAASIDALQARLASARESKRSPVGFEQAKAADSGRLPDANVSEALQRVQGITMSRQSAIADVDSYYAEGRDRFKDFDSNPIHRVAEAPVSTFSADVDTASYSFVRGQLNGGVLPQKDAVRAEEMVNYFDYDWPAASSRLDPLKPTIVVGDSPWSQGRKLVHIGIKGYEIDPDQTPDANLVLLIDVSGSMNEPNKLPLWCGPWRCCSTASSRPTPWVSWFMPGQLARCSSPRP